MNWHDIYVRLHEMIGTGPGDIVWWQMSARAFLIFLFGLVLIRLFGRSAFGKRTAVDIVLVMLIGSNLSRAITGNAPFLATVTATFVLVLFFWLFEQIAGRWQTFSRLMKGDPVPLVRQGRFDRERMTRTGISEGDIAEAARRAGLPGLDAVYQAILERSGTISTASQEDALSPGHGESKT